jgi:peptidoglycan/xylan/chitin deacetylase (PgdA/CDA1 family)
MDLMILYYYLRPSFDSIMYCFASFASMPRGYAILCYHRVLASDTENHIPGFLRVDVGSFKHQMQIIKSQAHPVSLVEMVERIKGGVKADALYVAVTFDDGYADNLEIAYPILKDLDIPATIFISTAYVDDHTIIPWWDELHPLVYNLRGILHIRYKETNLKLDMNTIHGKGASIARLTNIISHAKTIDKIDILSFLRSRVSNYPKPNRNAFTNWNQLKQVVSEGLITVGGHTVTHPYLTKCVDWGMNEIAEGKARLEDILGIPVNLFSYPFGEFNNDVIYAIHKTKFSGAVTGTLGINQAGDNVFCLKRIPVVSSKNENHFITRLKIAGNGLLASLFNRIAKIKDKARHLHNF